MAGLYHFIDTLEAKLRQIDAVPASEEDRRILDAALSLLPLPQLRSHSGEDYLSEAEVEAGPPKAGIPPQYKRSWTELSREPVAREVGEQEEVTPAKRQRLRMNRDTPRHVQSPATPSGSSLGGPSTRRRSGPNIASSGSGSAHATPA
ncbi:hypothetical protein AAF712_004661 [Marasmius tenuissimus]|uniref:Uncharacterized protein n=1 Tax=Marasmius tenuissimus TaxID=585030 RepID=A0ABR3A5J5_9AGAR